MAKELSEEELVAAAYALLAGIPSRHKDGLPRQKYLKANSPEEKAGRRALAILLMANGPLDDLLRRLLAGLIDHNFEYSTRPKEEKTKPQSGGLSLPNQVDGALNIIGAYRSDLSCGAEWGSPNQASLPSVASKPRRLKNCSSLTRHRSWMEKRYATLTNMPKRRDGSTSRICGFISLSRALDSRSPCWQKGRVVNVSTEKNSLMSRLTRTQSVQYLNANGYPISQRYFEKLSCPSGGQGPRVDLWFGGRALYQPEDLIAWALARSKPGDAKAA